MEAVWLVVLITIILWAVRWTVPAFMVFVISFCFGDLDKESMFFGMVSGIATALLGGLIYICGHEVLSILRGVL